MFGKLKQQRRIATRYDKTVLSFASFLNLPAARLWLKTFVNTNLYFTNSGAWPGGRSFSLERPPPYRLHRIARPSTVETLTTGLETLDKAGGSLPPMAKVIANADF